jgi:peptide/nickel transport system substrate-binding protein
MKRNLSLLLMILFLFTACTPDGTPTSPVSSETPAEAAIAAPTATPTEEPVEVLNVCTASLPEGLFPYDGKNPIAKQNLLDWTRVGWTSLAEPPTETNGGISLQPIAVQTGEIIVDASGTLTTLRAGVMVRPSGCRSTDCAITWDGTTVLTMDQMAVAFTLADGLSWSDGTPLTAADSVFSYDLASNPTAPGMQWAESHTRSYAAQGTNQILWMGIPGFSTADIARLYWEPLPGHLFAEGADFAAVADDPVWSGMLPSLGRYQVAAWSENGIRLVDNDQFAAASTDDAVYGEVNLQAIPNLEDALAALESGTCDVLDSSYHLERNAETLSGLEADPDLTVLVKQSPSWMQLVFGIQPASYDDYYNPIYGDRPDFFGDIRTRQAIAACLDREAIQEAVYAGLGEQWSSFVSPAESGLTPEQAISYDPAVGAQLLEAVGWRDHDLNPATPLQAWYIGNIPANTLFSITLPVDDSAVSQQIASIVQRSLGQCGIEVTPVTLTSAELYEPSAVGPLFGRQFDLALMGWAPSLQLDCVLYRSDQIPSEENAWIGTNIAGLTELVYDAACNDGSLALPSEREIALGLAEEQYLNALPAIPLVSLPEVMIASGEACSAFAALWPDGSVNAGCP